MVNRCCLDGALGELQVSVTIRMNCAVPRKEEQIREKRIFSMVKAGSV